MIFFLFYQEIFTAIYDIFYYKVCNMRYKVCNTRYKVCNAY